MGYLALAVKSERRIKPQITGLPYSQNLALKGGDDRENETLFDRALSKVSLDGAVPNAAEDRIAMVRILLERDLPGDAEKALSITDEMLLRGPITAELLDQKGAALYQLRRYEDAVVAFTLAIEKTPKMLAAYFNRSLAEEQLKRLDDARRDMEYYMSAEQDPKWKYEASWRLTHMKHDVDDEKR